MANDLLRFRPEFPILQYTTNMISKSLSDRFSPYFYTRDEELAKAIAAVDHILSSANAGG